MHGAPEPPHLWLVRHGETTWARTGRHTGRTDVPLTPRGRRDGRELAACLAGHEFSLVLSSPMQRALVTARLAGFGPSAEVTDDLHEWDYGDDEGRTTLEIRGERPGWTVWRDGPKGGETKQQVAARVDRVIRRAREQAGDTIVFAHGHVLRVLAARWLGEAPAEGRRYALGTGTVSELGWEREQPVMERWNVPCEGPA